MNAFNLSTMLSEAAARMRAGMASQLVPHPGERGLGSEVVFRRFLADHLPKRFKIDTGFVFDHSGDCSDQMDVVIVDSHVCPLFEDAEPWSADVICAATDDPPPHRHRALGS